MNSGQDPVLEAIRRWEDGELIDRPTAERLRVEVESRATKDTRRLSQYVLASTGAAILVIAGGVFLDWAWPALGVEGQAFLLLLGGLAVLAAGVGLEGRTRWRPAAYLMQTAGLTLVLAAYTYSERAWADSSPGGIVAGFLALATPVVLAPRSMRRNTFMPAVHLAMGLAFLAVFLDRATPLAYEARIWLLDGVLVLSILVLLGLLRSDHDGTRYPWALNAFIAGMAAGFVLVSVTAFDVLSMDDDGLLAVDVWLFLSVGLTLWGLHRAPPGLSRWWFARLLALECFAWIPLGMITVSEVFDGPSEMSVLLVSGVGVAAFIHADRHGLRESMTAASAAFIIPVWIWAVDRGGALGGVFALVLTAGLLFWASGRRGRDDDEDERD